MEIARSDISSELKQVLDRSASVVSVFSVEVVQCCLVREFRQFEMVVKRLTEPLRSKKALVEFCAEDFVIAQLNG